MSEVRCILASDLHLQSRAPVARSGEPDWFEAMTRPLEELAILADDHDAPVIYAGDLFDRWNSSAEVINFALEHLPFGYAVPGQHDLPHHNYDDIHRSAYWTLVEAERIINLTPGERTVVSTGLDLYGWPWGFAIEPPSRPRELGRLAVAVVHRFVWTKGTGYPGAPNSARLATSSKDVAAYDVAAFGDNHKGFIATPKGGPVVCNCGGFMRRKTDERDYRPGVGLLLDDGTVTRHYFDTSAEAFIEATAAEELVEQVLDMSEFVKGLRDLGATDALDFTAAIKRFLDTNDVPERVAAIILEAAE